MKPANRVTTIGQFALYNNIELTGNLQQHKLSKKQVKQELVKSSKDQTWFP